MCIFGKDPLAMPHPLLPSSSNTLKKRLLSGASAAVIVLALSVAMPTGVMAQEITGATGSATPLTGGVAITSGGTGG